MESDLKVNCLVCKERGVAGFSRFFFLAFSSFLYQPRSVFHFASHAADFDTYHPSQGMSQAN